MSEMQSLYDKDFYAWTMDTVSKLKNKQFNEIDLIHLTEEVEIMGAREKSELKNRLAILLAHLLKWDYQPEMNHGYSWKNTIEEQREEINDLLEDNPSLKSKIISTLPKAYKKGLRIAFNETGIAKKAFPQECPYTLEQLLDEDFYPMS